MYEFNLEQDIVINSEGEGYITSIDFEKIYNIILKYRNEIEEVIFLSFLGDRVPKEDFYPNVKYNQPILKIRTKLLLTFDQLEIKKDYDKVKRKILNCFSFDTKTFFLEGNRNIIKELVHIISYSFNSNQQNSEALLNEIQGFVVKLDYSFKNSNSKMVSNFLTIFLDEIKLLILQTPFNQAKYDRTLDLLYTLRNLSLSHRNPNLQKRIIETSYYLFEQAILNPSLLNYPEIQHLLYIHELTYSYNLENILKGENIDKIFEYYKFLYQAGIDTSFQIIVLIIKRYNYLSEEIRFNLLSKNAQYFLEFPKSFIQDQLIEDYDLDNPDAPKSFQENIFIYIIEYLFDLLAYSVSESMKKEYLSQIISQIILPLIIYVDFNFNYSKDRTTKLLSYIIIFYGTRRSNNYSLIEKEVIRPAGGYSPWIIDDSTSKILISLKYFIETSIFLPTIESINLNMPKNYEDEKEKKLYYIEQLDKLHTLLENLRDYSDRDHLGKLIGVTTINLNKTIENYLTNSGPIISELEEEIRNKN